jgi:hypothetical protein
LKHYDEREYVGGVCMTCKNIPTKIVSYDVGDAQVVQKYCDKCFKKWDKSKRKIVNYA